MTHEGQVQDRVLLADVEHYVACASQYVHAAERSVSPVVDRDVRAGVCWVRAVEALARLAGAPHA